MRNTTLLLPKMMELPLLGLQPPKHRERVGVSLFLNLSTQLYLLIAVLSQFIFLAKHNCYFHDIAGGTERAQGDTRERCWTGDVKCDPGQNLTLVLMVFPQIISGQVNRLLQTASSKTGNRVIRRLQKCLRLSPDGGSSSEPSPLPPAAG